MKQMKVVLVLALLYATPSWASKIIGNGGDVLVCPERTPRVMLLDFVESRVLRKNSIVLWNPPGRSYLQKLEALNANIARRFPVLAAVIAKEVAFFEEKNVKERDIELEDINDSYHKLRLPGCHVEQIANQSIPLFDDDPWFLINMSLWEQLDEVDKAGLVLHEVLYRMGLRHGLEHSIGIRYLVSLLFQENLHKVSDRQWTQAFLHSRLRRYETGGVRFPLFRGEEKECEVVPGTVQCADGDPTMIPAEIVFTPNRRIRSVTFEQGSQAFEFMHDNFKTSWTTSEMVFEWVSDSEVEIMSEGRLKMARSTSLLDVMLMDVRGRIHPRTGHFAGEYRVLRVDMHDQDDKWHPFNGNLSELFIQRPAVPDNPVFRR